MKSMLAAFALSLIATAVYAEGFDMAAITAPAEKRVATEKKKLQAAVTEFFAKSKADPERRSIIQAQNTEWMKRAQAFCDEESSTGSGNTASAAAYQEARALNCLANSFPDYIARVKQSTAALTQ